MANYAPGVEDYKRACQRACEGVDSAEFYKYRFSQQRQWYLNLFRAFPIPRPANIVVRDDAVVTPTHEIPLRIYRSRTAGAHEPCILYAHGGGFVNGALEASDSIAADLADRLGLTVITLHYRLAPEFRHPAALEDCYQALVAVAEQAASHGIDPARIVFAGESCGGSFAAGVSMLSRDRGGPRLFGQVPINPVFNLHRWARREVEDCSEEFQVEMHHYTSNYLGSNMELLPEYASPLLAKDLSGLPPAFIWAVESDPLSKEAKAYAERLRAAGVPAECHIHEGVVHGCLRARGHYTFASEAFDTLCEGFRALLGRQGS
ncbi:alpha/beta hydrolase [Corallococcus terminator]